MTRDETIRALAVLAAVWPTREITDATIEAYGMAWADLPYPPVNAAIGAWLRQGKFFPAPSEIRELVIGKAAALDGAEQAWGEVKRQIAAVGHRGHPRWSSEPLERAIAAIGWRDLCVCQEGDVGTLRAHFYRTYESYRRQYATEHDYPELVAAVAEQRQEHRLEDDARRLLPVYQEPRALPASGASAWEDAYRAIGEDAYSTVRTRERHRGSRTALPPARWRTLATLLALPAWRALPEGERTRLLARYGREGAGDDRPV